MIIHKILNMPKNHLKYLKNSILKCFLKEYNSLLFLKKKIFFSQHIMMESLSLEEENIIKDLRNLLRLRKGTKAHCS